MTPHIIDTRQQPLADPLSTSDLVAPRMMMNVNSVPPAASDPEQQPNLPLFTQHDTQDFRSRWEKTQIGFVDEPRKAVEQADELVAGAIKRLSEVFATERHKLETAWDKTDKVSTEDLRLALRRYRSFFDRLLSI